MSEKKKTTLKEFSKRIVAWVQYTYFVGVAVGAVYVLWYGAGLSDYLTYLGSVTGLTIGGYLAKAGFENLKKISKHSDNGGV
jgi:divalent metal cation (Fe/Co/Zn/Cd) transporter